ncbi:MAG: hypothetical protein ABFR62_13095 [Bacteroidota bacterium]
MKNTRVRYMLFAILIVVLFSACAKVSPLIDTIITDNSAGFWSGLLHGLILPFSFIGSLFMDDVAIYAYNNVGGWYDFGFLLGASCSIGGSSRATKRKKCN